MLKRIESLTGGRGWFFSLLFVTLAGLFLRLSSIYETATFLGDQGRDAIVMHDIVTLHHFPALGPVTSVGSIFLGPLYYYIMAPWLLLTGFNPIGPALGIAIITTLCIPAQYFAVKEMTNKQTALLSTFFTSLSWVLIEYSRFSWNPNLLPQVTFFAIYTLYKIIRTKQLKYFIAHGALVSFAIQLHYLAIFLIPLSITTLLVNDLNEKKKTLLLHVGNTAVMALSFLVPLAPFLIFEAIHSFPNFRSVLHFSSTNSGSSSTPFLNELFTTLQNAIRFAFQTSISQPMGAAIIIGLVGGFVLSLKYKRSMSYVFASILVLLLGISLYRGPKYAHYLGGLYILLYVAVSYVLILIVNRSRYLGIGALLIVTLLFTATNAPKYYYLTEREHQNQIDKADKTARTILSMKPGATFTITSSPDAYADYPYRYFLQALGHPAVSKEQDSYATPTHLFVICETDCNPMNDPQWAVAHFNATQILEKKKVEPYPWITVYKLTH